MALDPVCGMTVDEKSAKHKMDWNGRTFFFCSPGCLANFKSDPSRYVG